eukprot:4427175-Lingulodinium_polyedra.AAC.1
MVSRKVRELGSDAASPPVLDKCCAPRIATKIIRSVTRVDCHCGPLYEQNSLRQAHCVVGRLCLVPLVLPAAAGYMEHATFAAGLFVVTCELPVLIIGGCPLPPGKRRT